MSYKEILVHFDHSPTGVRRVDVAGRLARHARYADLLVLGQPGGDDSSDVDDHATELLLLSSGRPVLLIPHVGSFRRSASASWWPGTRAMLRRMTVPVLMSH